MAAAARVPGSFRDPSGHVFVEDGVLYRAVNAGYRPHYERLLDSGLYRALVDDGLLIPHEEVPPRGAGGGGTYKTIKPETVRFISYPYEWCFGQLRDAALTTLRIQKAALERGLTLKDCSAYNIQFHQGRPLLIDTLSFESLREGEPWSAYRQFCQHFLAPLAVLARADPRLGQLLRIHLDGLPLDLTASLLPLRSRFSFGLLLHLHLHARSQARYADRPVVKTSSRSMSRTALLGLVESLESAVAGLAWKPPRTAWGDYYDNTNYSAGAFAHKSEVVAGFLETLAPNTVWDLGANDGTFSRLASGKGRFTLSCDLDPVAVEKNYRRAREEGDRNLLPLLLDLANPSPALGWAHTERMSLAERGPADLALALGLVHHLAIANNLPLPAIASFFRRVANSLIVEFVPKTDSQTRRLLRSREDVFPGYDQQGFERAFAGHFRIESAVRVRDSERTLYAMRAA